jgi:SWI/SNF-related matrix-associated actin-dependent regulator of chromatin subfamily A protein 2/4
MVPITRANPLGRTSKQVRISRYVYIMQVRTEARKVHDLFFDILKIAFPDTDFREARNALSFSGPSSTSVSALSAKQAALGLSKRNKSINNVEPDNSTTHKPMQRGSIPKSEDIRSVRVPQKETRVGSGSGSGSGSSREQYRQDDSPLHPGELVICKKKRKDRDKSAVRSRTGSSGPVSPPSMGRNITSPVLNSIPKDARLNTSPVLNSIPKDARLSQQNRHQQGWVNQPQPPNGGVGSVGWANPVKRLRTDAGKRRPSHL